MMMFDLDNAEAGYVVAAYSIAAVALLGLLCVSWHSARIRRREWIRLKDGDGVGKV